MSPENSPVVCDGYVKYEEAEVDRLAVMKYYINNEKKGAFGFVFALRKYHKLFKFKMAA